MFLYGCSAALSWMPDDTDNPASTGYKQEDNAFKVSELMDYERAFDFVFHILLGIINSVSDSAAV